MHRLLLLCAVVFCGACATARRGPAPLVHEIGRPAPRNAAKESAFQSGVRTASDVPPETMQQIITEFVEQVAEVGIAPSASLAVLPPLHVNRALDRYDVTGLGDELAAEILREIHARALAVTLLSPSEWQLAVEASNRSLADLSSPREARALTRRIGARYLICGLIEDSRNDITLRLECRETDEDSVLAVWQRTMQASTSVARELYSRHKSASGQPTPGEFRPGLAAAARPLSLSAEIEWMFSGAARRLLAEGAASLTSEPLAIPPTRLPDSFRFESLRDEFRRATTRQRNLLIGSGLTDVDAAAFGPVEIVGQRFETLQAALDYAESFRVQAEISDRGAVSSALSRALFDQVERIAASQAVELVPHEQLIDRAVDIARSNVDHSRDGSIDEATLRFFETKGASTVLVSDLVRDEIGYSFRLQIRRLETMEPLTSALTLPIESRFTSALQRFLQGPSL